MKRDIFHRRWYDKNLILSEAFVQLEDLSPVSQHLIAQVLDKLSDHSHSVGNDSKKTVALMKSKNKRRWYDQDALLHKAVNQMLMLDDEPLDRIAQVIGGPIHVLSEYEQHCRQRQCPIQEQQLDNLLKVTIAKGIAAGSHYVQLLMEKAPPLEQVAAKASMQ